MTTQIEFLKENFADLNMPNKCHACSKPCPDSSILLTARGGAIIPANEDILKGWPIDVPACKGCKTKIWVSRWIASALLWISIIVLMLVVFLINMIFPDLSTTANVILLIILAAASVAIMPKIFTAPFDVEPYAERLMFYYKDDSLGEEFARLNGITEVADLMNQPRILVSDSELESEETDKELS